MTKKGKHCGKRKDCTFSKSCLLQRRRKASICGKGLSIFSLPMQEVQGELL